MFGDSDGENRRSQKPKETGRTGGGAAAAMEVETDADDGDNDVMGKDEVGWSANVSSRWDTTEPCTGGGKE